MELEALRNVYALGDCCALVDNPLPPLAQVRALGLEFVVEIALSQMSLVPGSGSLSCMKVMSAKVVAPFAPTEHQQSGLHLWQPQCRFTACMMVTAHHR